jgi:hypothetical protein
MVKFQPSKLAMRVRFPLPALFLLAGKLEFQVLPSKNPSARWDSASIFSSLGLEHPKVVTIPGELVKRNGSVQRAYDRAGAKIACAIEHSRAGCVSKSPGATRYYVSPNAMVDACCDRA